jgi:hypothetical protein
MTRLTMELSWADAYAASAILAGTAAALHSLELIAIREEFGDGGLLSRVGGSSTWTRALFSPPAFFSWLVLEFVAAIAIATDARNPPIWALVTVFAVRALANARNRACVSGADQMQLVVWGALLVAALSPDAALVPVCGWFVCLQLTMAYVTAGSWKAATPLWRSGAALAGLLRTRTFGLAPAHAVAVRFPAVVATAAWATITFELAAPWLVLAGPGACLVFLGAGILFHAAAAIIMGLDEFFWAFVATYPLVLRCSIDVERLWRGLSLS